MPKVSLREKQDKLSATPKQFVQNSQYIFDGFKTNTEGYRHQMLPFAVMLAHARETTANRENFKNYRKRFNQQTKRVKEFLLKVDSVQSQLQTIVDSSVDTLFENTNNPYYKGHPVDLHGYNNMHKYIDIYGAILDCNIHLMTIGSIPTKWIHTVHHGHQSLIPIYHSYVRMGKPHIYILRLGGGSDMECTTRVDFTYHAISCIYTLMEHTFGFVDFCNQCHRCTYLKNGSHKYCGVVTPSMQYISAYDFAVKQNKKEWRPHFNNIQTAVNTCLDTNFDLSLDDFFDKLQWVYECLDNGDIINVHCDDDSIDDSASVDNSVSVDNTVSVDDSDSIDDSASIDESPKKKQKLNECSSLPADNAFESDYSDHECDL